VNNLLFCHQNIINVDVQLAGCEHIRRVRFHHCAYVDDECVLATVERLKGSLQQLELSSCDISDTGLRHLTQLQSVLYSLSLFYNVIAYFSNNIVNNLSDLCINC